jgi:hypothetical protein
MYISHDSSMRKWCHWAIRIDLQRYSEMVWLDEGFTIGGNDPHHWHCIPITHIFVSGLRFQFVKMGRDFTFSSTSVCKDKRNQIAISGDIGVMDCSIWHPARYGTLGVGIDHVLSESVMILKRLNAMRQLAVAHDLSIDWQREEWSLFHRDWMLSLQFLY